MQNNLAINRHWYDNLSNYSPRYLTIEDHYRRYMREQNNSCDVRHVPYFTMDKMVFIRWIQENKILNLHNLTHFKIDAWFLGIQSNDKESFDVVTCVFHRLYCVRKIIHLA